MMAADCLGTRIHVHDNISPLISFLWITGPFQGRAETPCLGADHADGYLRGHFRPAGHHHHVEAVRDGGDLLR